MDRYYQRHKSFDDWQTEGKHFICRIKASTTRREIRKTDIQPGGIVFYDAVVLLGTPYVNQTEKEVRLVGYRVENVDYWIATDRHDLSAEQIALVRENKRLATMAKRSSYLSIYSRMNGRRR